MANSIELPSILDSTFEYLTAKNIQKDYDDSTEPFSDEDEYPPQDPTEDDDRASSDSDHDDQCQAVERFPARGNAKADSAKAPPKNNSQGSNKPASTTKKTSVTRPPPSNNTRNYSDSSKRK